MKIKLLTTVCGPEGTFDAGKVAEVPDELAKNLLEGGYAEAVDGAPAAAAGDAGELETADLEAPETAESPKVGRKKKAE